MKKVGIIRCQQTEDVCPGVKDFKAAAAGTGAFELTGPAEVIGFVSCGGCPGKRAVLRAQTLVKLGAEAVFMASCMKRGSPAPIDMPCPHADAIRDAIARKIGDVPVVDWSHG